MVTSSVPSLVRDVPVDPDAQQARGWLVEELSRPEYSHGESLLDRLWRWFVGLFDRDLPVLDLPPWQLAAILVGVVAAIVLVAWWVAGPVRLARRAASRPGAVFDDDERSAAELLAAADAAAGAGDWPLAVTERFRAVVRSLEERVVVDPRPGRTAQEAATAAAERLPALGEDLHAGASLFDDVRYGHVPVGPEADARLRALWAAVAAARPVRRAEGAEVAR